MGALGIVLFALGIAASIALHEAGHMFTARAFGMRVRRYFIGFGPTLWSTHRGETEYGIAALPFGGFCDIVGMTASDPMTEDERPFAMVNKPWWQRVAVLSGGVAVNVLISLVIVYLLAVFASIPNPYADRSVRVGDLACTSDQIDAETLADCTGNGPAAEAGLEVGDVILAVDSKRIDSFYQVRDEVIGRPGQTIDFKIDRNGTDMTVPVTADAVKRIDARTGETITAGAIGVQSAPNDNAVASFSPLNAVPASLALNGQMFRASVEGLVSFPSKIPGVVASIFGGERDLEGPVSVIGASRAGGELVQHSMWEWFWLMLASLNLFLALFNLVPLPPLDGGHVAVVLWEQVRDWLRRRRGEKPGGPVDYEKLMPVTLGMAGLLLVVGLFVMVADVVNPVRLFG